MAKSFSEILKQIEKTAKVTTKKETGTATNSGIKVNDDLKKKLTNAKVTGTEELKNRYVQQQNRYAQQRESLKARKSQTDPKTQNSFLQKALALYQSDNSDAQYNRDYFTVAVGDEMDELRKVDKKNATPMQAAKSIDIMLKLQAGINYRAGRGEEPDYTPGDALYGFNDAANEELFKREVDTWFQKVKDSKDGKEVQEVLDYWKTGIDGSTENSQYRQRLSELYTQLQDYGVKNYSSLAGQQVKKLNDQIASNNAEIDRMTISDKYQADAQRALRAIDSGSNDAITLVQSDPALRSLTDFDNLRQRYSDDGDLYAALYDRIYGIAQGNADKEENYIRMADETTALQKQLQAAAANYTNLKRTERYAQMLGQDWVGNWADRFDAPDYQYRTDGRIEHEDGALMPTYQMNKATLDQIVEDPDAVLAQLDLYKGDAAVNDGTRNTVVLAKRMTEDERELYKAIAAHDGEAAADAYFEYLTPELNKREGQAIAQKSAEFAEEHPVLGTIGSFGTNVLGSIGKTSAAVRGSTDQYDPSLQFGMMTDTTRETVSESIDNDTLRWLYGVGTSAGDTLTAQLLGGPLGSVIMGMSAGGDIYQDALERTGDVATAQMEALAGGLLEYMTEKISWGKLGETGDLTSALGKAKYIGKNVLTEGLEEGVSSAGNDVFQLFLEGRESEIYSRYKYYKDNGYSDKEAGKKVAQEQVQNLLLEMAAGGLTGGVFSGGNVAINAAQQNAVNRATGRQIMDRGNAAMVIEMGLQSEDKAVQRVSQILLDKLTSGEADADPTQTAAEMQYVAEAVEGEGKQGKISKRKQQKEALEKARQEKLERAKAGQLQGQYKGSKARLGKLYTKVLGALDVEMTNSREKLKTGIKESLEKLGEKPLDEVVEGLAAVALNEPMTRDQLDLVQAISEREGIVKDVIEAYDKSGLAEARERYRLFREATQRQVERSELQAVSGAKEAQEAPAEAQVGVQVAETGQTSYTTETGDVISAQVEGFAESENGEILAMMNGESVPVNSVQAADEGEATLIYRAAQMGNAQAASAMYENYDAAQDVDSYTRAFESVFNYATIGRPEMKVRKLKLAGELTDAQFAQAYRLGSETTARKPRPAVKTGGKVSFAGGLEQRMDGLNDNQKGAIAAITELAKTGTMNIEFFESVADESGSYAQYENGSYNPDTNTLRFDVNAGKDSVDDVAEFAMMRVAGHELTHFMREQNPEGYAAYQNFIIDQMEQQGGGAFDELVAAKMEQQDGLSFADAAEEVIADGSEMMMKESTVMEQLAQKDRNLFEKIRDWLHGFVENVRRAFAGVSARSVEARMLERVEGMQQMWDSVLLGAMENVRGAQETSAQSYQSNGQEREDTTVKYQLRGYSEHQKNNWENSKNIVLYENAEQLNRFVNDALAGNNVNKKIYFGIVPDTLSERVKADTGIDISGYNVALRAFEVRKINADHGSEARENMRGQRAITVEDFAMIPEIIENPDRISRSEKDYEGKPAILFEKTINGRTTIVTYVTSKHHDLTVQTMYSSKKNRSLATTPSGQMTFSQTPETLSGTASKQSIAEAAGNVKKSVRRTMPSDRELLANAFEGVAENATEREFLERYKKGIADLNEKQKQLAQIRKEIREMQASPHDRRDRKYLDELHRQQNRANLLAENINDMDDEIVKMIKSKPLANVLQGLKEAQRMAELSEIIEGKAVQKYRRARERTELRRQIRNFLDDFNRRLQNPTKTRYIPKNMVQLVIKAGELVNVTREKQSEKASEKLLAIRDMYERYKEDGQFPYAYDENMSAMIESVQKQVGDKSIYQLSNGDLKTIYDMLRALKKTVSEAAYLKSREGEVTIFEAGTRMYRETQEAAPFGSKWENRVGKAASEKVGDMLNWQLTPDKFFARLAGYKKNSEWSEVAKSFSDGTQKMLEVQRDAYYHFRKWTESSEFDKLGSTKEKDMVDIGLKDADGNTIKITRGMMLSAYMHLNSEDNTTGFMYGGFSVPNLKKYYAGKVAEAYGTGSVNTMGTAAEVAQLADKMYGDDNISDEEFAKLKEQSATAQARGEKQMATMRETIEGMMTNWEKQLVAAVHEWNDGKSRNYINDVTMDLYGIKKAGVKNYYPIHRDTAFVNTDFASISRNMNLENWGSLKDRVPSRAPILLTDIAFEMDNSVKQMSRYVGYARAQRDFNKLYNVRMPGMAGSVKKVVGVKFGTGKRMLGASGEQYIENYIGSITGSRKGEGDILTAIRRNLPRATMSLNFRVGFSQISALPKAAVEVGWKNLAEGMAHGGAKAIFSKKAREELAQKNAWFWQRYQGEGGQREFADAKGGRGVIDRAWNTVDDKTGGWLLNLNQKVDVATTAAMWSSAEAWVRNNKRDLHAGSEAFENAVNEKFTDILRNTQAANTVSERSDLARSTKGFDSILTMYKSEAFANFNIMYDSVVKLRKYRSDLKEGKNGVTEADVRQAKWQLANSITSVVIASSVLNAVIKLGINAITSNMSGYRDEEEEVTLASIAESIIKEFLSDQMGMVVYGGQLYDLISATIMKETYYAPSYAALDELTTMAETAVNFANKEDKGREDFVKAGEKVFYAAMNMLGIPAKNATRQAEGLVNTIKDIAAGRMFSFEASVDRTTSTNIRRLAIAELEGDSKKWDEVYAELKRNYLRDSEEELTDEEFDEEMVSRFKSYVGEQYKKGELSRKDAEKLIKNRTDVTDEHDLFWQFDKWDYAIENGSQEGYAIFQRMEDAVASKDDTTITDTITFYTEHGYEKKDVLSTLTSKTKQLYCEDVLTWEEAIEMLVEYCNSAANDYDYVHNQYWLKREWDYAKANDGSSGDYSKYGDFYTAIESGMDASKYVKELYEHNKSVKDAKSAASTSISSRYKNAYIDAAVAGDTELAEKLLDYAILAYKAIGKNKSKSELKRTWVDDK